MCSELYVPSLFEAHLDTWPEAIALYEGQQTIQYRVLNNYANALAAYLNVQHIGPGSIVGVCLTPSIALGIALLGILKSGAAYCLLDPSYPVQRLNTIMEDAPLTACITCETMPVINWIKQHDCLLILSQQITSLSEPNAPFLTSYPRDPKHLAYLIYTSGSTGKPKGVPISHRNLASFLLAMQKQVPLRVQDRFFSLTSIAFDIFGLEFFLPLLSGASCILNSSTLVRDPEKLVETIEYYQPQLMQATPALWHLLVETGWQNNSLHAALCGGEAWDIHLSKKLFACLAEHCQLLNLYGPTETTIWSSCGPVTKEDTVITLGKPLANTQLYILNAQLQKVSEGILYIGGEGVAQGYWRQAKLSAQKFIADPFNPAPNARLFCTGDLVKQEKDRLIFLERMDEQVKIRGFRVNLTEVEQHLYQQNNICQVAVIAIPAETTQALHAFIVQTTPGFYTEKQLNVQLRLTLPDFMVPTAFYFVDKLPLSSSGKVDKHALKQQILHTQAASKADPGQDAVPMDSRDTFPTHSRKLRLVTETLKAIWCSLLNMQDIHQDAGFLELGGHSLLVVNLLSRIRKTFQIPCSVPEIMKHLVFSEQLYLILEKQADLQAQEPSVNQPKNPVLLQNTAPFPLSFGQQELWEIDHKYQAGLAVYSPSAYHIKGPFEINRFRFAVQQLMQRHEILRTVIVESDAGQAVQQVLSNLEAAIAFEDLYAKDLSATEMESCIQKRLAQDEIQHFDLAQGPLLRFSVLKTGSENFILMMNHHSIIMDGWSKTNFLRELGTAYGRYSLNTFSDSPLQYRQFVTEQFAWLNSEYYLKERSFWQARLGTTLRPVYLDFGQAIPHTRSFVGAVKRFVLPAALTQAILDFNKQQGFTLFMFLMSNFFISIAQFTKDKQLFLSTVMAGRDTVEQEKMLGMMINTVLFKADLRQDPTLLHLLEKTQHDTIATIAHQRIPFYKLLDTLGVDLQSYHKLPGNIMLLVHNTPPRVLDFGETFLTKRLRRFPKTAVLDIIFECTLQSENNDIEVFVEYSTDLYTPTMIEKLFKVYTHCIHYLLNDPSIRLSTLHHQMQHVVSP